MNKIKYEPWADSHSPARFQRTDPTGRWSPIVEPEKDYPAVYLWVSAACFIALLSIALTGGI